MSAATEVIQPGWDDDDIEDDDVEDTWHTQGDSSGAWSESGAPCEGDLPPTEDGGRMFTPLNQASFMFRRCVRTFLRSADPRTRAVSSGLYEGSRPGETCSRQVKRYTLNKIGD